MADKIETEYPHVGTATKMASHATSAEGVERVPREPPLQVVVGVLMIVALLVASVIVGQREPKKAAVAAAAAATATPAPAASAPETPTSDALVAEFKEIKSQIDELSAQIKGLQGKVDELPAPPPAPDLKPITGKVDDLAQSVAAVLPLSDKVEKLDGRVGAFDNAMTSIKDEISGLTAEVKKLADTPPVTTATSASASADDAPSLATGVDLFKAGKYKEAADVFKKIASANPNDARVYYYEALTNGLTTKDWQGETVKMAARGAALEKAGATKPAEVDAAFSDLPTTLKPWLAYFRSQAR